MAQVLGPLPPTREAGLRSTLQIGLLQASGQRTSGCKMGVCVSVKEKMDIILTSARAARQRGRFSGPPAALSLGLAQSGVRTCSVWAGPSAGAWGRVQSPSLPPPRPRGQRGRLFPVLWDLVGLSFPARGDDFWPGPCTPPPGSPGRHPSASWAAAAVPWVGVARPPLPTLLHGSGRAFRSHQAAPVSPGSPSVISELSVQLGDGPRRQVPLLDGPYRDAALSTEPGGASSFLLTQGQSPRALLQARAAGLLCLPFPEEPSSCLPGWAPTRSPTPWAPLPRTEGRSW